jgi:hypothetical protein
MIFHVLNRANARLGLFVRGGDYAAFERVLVEALGRSRVELLARRIQPLAHGDARRAVEPGPAHRDPGRPRDAPGQAGTDRPMEVKNDS